MSGDRSSRRRSGSSQNSERSLDDDPKSGIHNHQLGLGKELAFYARAKTKDKSGQQPGSKSS